MGQGNSKQSNREKDKKTPQPECSMTNTAAGTGNSFGAKIYQMFSKPQPLITSRVAKRPCSPSSPLPPSSSSIARVYRNEFSDSPPPAKFQKVNPSFFLGKVLISPRRPLRDYKAQEIPIPISPLVTSNSVLSEKTKYLESDVSNFDLSTPRSLKRKTSSPDYNIRSKFFRSGSPALKKPSLPVALRTAQVEEQEGEEEEEVVAVQGIAIGSNGVLNEKINSNDDITEHNSDFQKCNEIITNGDDHLTANGDDCLTAIKCTDEVKIDNALLDVADDIIDKSLTDCTSLNENGNVLPAEDIDVTEPLNGSPAKNLLEDDSMCAPYSPSQPPRSLVSAMDISLTSLVSCASPATIIHRQNSTLDQSTLDDTFDNVTLESSSTKSFNITQVKATVESNDEDIVSEVQTEEVIGTEDSPSIDDSKTPNSAADMSADDQNGLEICGIEDDVSEADVFFEHCDNEDLAAKTSVREEMIEDDDSGTSGGDSCRSDDESCESFTPNTLPRAKTTNSTSISKKMLSAEYTVTQSKTEKIQERVDKASSVVDTSIAADEEPTEQDSTQTEKNSSSNPDDTFHNHSAASSTFSTTISKMKWASFSLLPTSSLSVLPIPAFVKSYWAKDSSTDSLHSKSDDGKADNLSSTTANTEGEDSSPTNASDSEVSDHDVSSTSKNDASSTSKDDASSTSKDVHSTCKDDASSTSKDDASSTSKDVSSTSKVRNGVQDDVRNNQSVSSSDNCVSITEISNREVEDNRKSSESNSSIDHKSEDVASITKINSAEEKTPTKIVSSESALERHSSNSSMHLNKSNPNVDDVQKCVSISQASLQTAALITSRDEVTTKQITPAKCSQRLASLRGSVEKAKSSVRGKHEMDRFVRAIHHKLQTTPVSTAKSRKRRASDTDSNKSENFSDSPMRSNSHKKIRLNSTDSESGPQQESTEESTSQLDDETKPSLVSTTKDVNGEHRLRVAPSTRGGTGAVGSTIRKKKLSLCDRVAPLHDDSSAAYINNSQVLILIKPSNGSKELVQQLRQRFPASLFVTATNGTKKKRGRADSSTASVQRGLRELRSPLIVEVERGAALEPYLLLAHSANYCSLLLQEPQYGAAVPYRNYRPILPFCYSWFLKLTDSVLLSNLAREVFSRVLKLRDFECDLRLRISPALKRRELLSAYTPNNVVGGPEVLHCTAKGGAWSDPSYCSNRDVIDALGAVTRLTVVGFVITPRTFGARVRLTTDQLRLWGNSDAAQLPKTLSALFRRQRNITALKPQVACEDDAEDGLEESNDEFNGTPECNMEQKTLEMIPRDEELDEFNPTSGVGSRAHITLGCLGQDIHPRTTGYDQLLAITKELEAKEARLQLAKDSGAIKDKQCSAGDLSVHTSDNESNSLPSKQSLSENVANGNQSEDGSVVSGDAANVNNGVGSSEDTTKSYEIEGAKVVCYGDGVWVVYPDKFITVSAMFSGFHSTN